MRYVTTENIVTVGPILARGQSCEIISSTKEQVTIRVGERNEDEVKAHLDDKRPIVTVPWSFVKQAKERR